MTNTDRCFANIKAKLENAQGRETDVPYPQKPRPGLHRASQQSPEKSTIEELTDSVQRIMVDPLQSHPWVQTPGLQLEPSTVSVSSPIRSRSEARGPVEDTAFKAAT